MREKSAVVAILALSAALLSGCGPFQDEKFMFGDGERKGEDFSWPAVLKMDVAREGEKMVPAGPGMFSAELRIMNVSEDLIDGSFSVSTAGYAYRGAVRAEAMEEFAVKVPLPLDALEPGGEIRVSVDCGRRFGVFRRVSDSFRLRQGQHPVAVRLYAYAADRLVLEVENRLKFNELGVSATLAYGDDKFEDSPRTAGVQPGGTVFFEYSIPGGRRKGKAVTASVGWGEGYGLTGGKYTFDSDTESLNMIRRVDFPVEIDGDISCWFGRDYIRLASEESVFPEGERREAWGGPGDKSAKLYLGWDTDNLYIAAEVTDDAHFNRSEGGAIWDGDSLQFALYKPGKPGAFNLGLALASGEARFHQWKGPELADDVRYAVIRNEAENKTYYEWSAPLGALMLEPGDGSLFGFNAVFFDDDDGEGYDYWLQLAPGIAGGWDPSSFGRYMLVE